MRRLSMLLVVFGLAWMTYAMIRGEPLDSASPAAQRQALLKAREEVWKSWFTYDPKRLQVLVPADTLAINAGEERWSNQQEEIEAASEFAANGGKLVRLEFPRTEIQVYGDVAILYSLYRLETETNGKHSAQSGRATEVFVLRNGQWVNPGWHTDSGR